MKTRKYQVLQMGWRPFPGEDTFVPVLFEVGIVEATSVERALIEAKAKRHTLPIVMERGAYLAERAAIEAIRKARKGARQ